MRSAIALVVATVSCGAAQEPATDVRRPSAETRPLAIESGCVTNKSALRVVLDVNQLVRTPTGIDVTYLGAQHDDFDDGRFEDSVSFRFQRRAEIETRMVSIHARQAQQVLTGCWRLLEASPSRAVIELLPWESSSSAFSGEKS